MVPRSLCSFFFFFNDTATTEIYTLSLHDALPISLPLPPAVRLPVDHPDLRGRRVRSEEHTSELQSRQYLVCRLLLEKKKKQNMSECGNALHGKNILTFRSSKIGDIFFVHFFF